MACCAALFTNIMSFIMFIFNQTCLCTKSEDEQELVEIETEVFNGNNQSQNNENEIENINKEKIYQIERVENDERLNEEIFEGNPWTMFTPEKTPDTSDFEMEVFSQSSEQSNNVEHSERSDSHTFEEIQRSKLESSESPD